MNSLDWIVLSGILVFIVLYGIWKGRNERGMQEYLLSKNMKWYTVGLSIMATQASAITFLSAPGQAFEDGMRFVQFYFGLPLAMIFISIFMMPIYGKLNVITAYEYLETRFDYKVRAFGAFIFLLQRSLGAGLTIYAPAIILSGMMGWDIFFTNLAIGGIVVVYTVAGGAKAISATQTFQMALILAGMLVAAFLMVDYLPEEVSFGGAVAVAGKMGKLNAIDFTFDLENKYNVWTGLLGGFFLMLSYFGTDQSQVGRYLGGKSLAQSRLGLMFNGFLKIPMQFGILFIGAIMYVFYLFAPSPVFFNDTALAAGRAGNRGADLSRIESEYARAHIVRKEKTFDYLSAQNAKSLSGLRESQNTMDSLKTEAKTIIAEASKEKSDVNYIFLSFVKNYLPHGIIGLLMAVIFSASMSSSSSELGALASTTVVDIYKRAIKKDGDDLHYLKASKWITVLWGVFAIAMAQMAGSFASSLIELVNTLGSLFYGTILGIFMVAFFMKKIKADAVFVGAGIAQCAVLAVWKFTDIPFLWFNPIGCAAVMLFAFMFQSLVKLKYPAKINDDLDA